MKKKGSVVQLDRISDFGSEGWGFESSLGHQKYKIKKNYLASLVFFVELYSMSALTRSF